MILENLPKDAIIPSGVILLWHGDPIPQEEAEKRGYYIYTKEEALRVYYPRRDESMDISICRQLILADRLQIIMKK